MENVSVIEDMHTFYLPLDELAKMVWQENAKLHAAELISYSIERFGFNDPIEVGRWKVGEEVQMMIVAGHGRLEQATSLLANSRPLPEHVIVTEGRTDNMWSVPCVFLTFASKEDAILYALYHNRAANKKLHLDDYSAGKLVSAIRASGANQLTLVGFDDAQLTAGADVAKSAAAPGKMQVPGYKPFDATALQDTPASLATVPATYTLMVTLPTFRDLRRVVEILTLGERKSLPLSARMATVDGIRFMDQWAAALLNGQSVKTTPAPIGEEGRAPSPDELTGEEGEPEPPAAEEEPNLPLEEGGVPASANPPWATSTLPAVAEATAQEPAAAKNGKKRKAPKEGAEHEPHWVGGLCADCGGSGSKGNPADPQKCESCKGYGEESKYKAAVLQPSMFEQ